MRHQIEGSVFQEGELIYVFEQGEGKFIADLGYDEKWGDELYQVEIDEERVSAHSSDCFHFHKAGEKIYRVWQMGNAKIKVTYKPISLINLGNDVKVAYGKNQTEMIRHGQRLHKDWEGYGVDFLMIITKWLRRLNGERIPLSKYYEDPVNRMLDNS